MQTSFAEYCKFCNIKYKFSYNIQFHIKTLKPYENVTFGVCEKCANSETVTNQIVHNIEPEIHCKEQKKKTSEVSTQDFKIFVFVLCLVIFCLLVTR